MDRLWPQGLTKEKAGLDLCLKEISPSTELRNGFGHDPEKWKEFQKRYHKELIENKEAVSTLKDHLKGAVSLLYAAKEEEHNEAFVLKNYLSSSM